MQLTELRDGDEHPREGLFYICFVLVPPCKYHYGLQVHPLRHVMIFTEEQGRSGQSRADTRGWESYRETLMQLKEGDTRNGRCCDCTERVRVRPSGCS